MQLNSKLTSARILMPFDVAQQGLARAGTKRLLCPNLCSIYVSHLWHDCVSFCRVIRDDGCV